MSGDYDAKAAEILAASNGNGNGKGPAQGFTPRPDTRARWGKRDLGHGRRVVCMERCIEVQAARERNSLRRRARLLKALKDLGLKEVMNRQDIAQRVLEAKDAEQGNCFKPLSAADRAAMPRPVVRWLLPGVVPLQDMTIIGGRPKVGKTRVAVAMAAAVMNGTGFLGFPAPAHPRPVILVTDDQSDGDSAEMLEAVGAYHHPFLTWSRNFRLNERDLDALLRTIGSLPGALIVLDSLRSIGRNLQHGENDPEIGATLYDLKQAVIDSGSTLLLVHHCNKAMDLVGVEALSGHNAIAGAANTVLTMHYLAKSNGQPNKTAPERRLFREGRSGEGFDLVVSRDGAGSFTKAGETEAWEAEAQAAEKLAKLAPLQQQVREVLEGCVGWLTRREVCDLLDIPWGERGRGPEARRVEDALKALVALGVVESVSAGTGATYRPSSPCSRTNVSDVPPSHIKGSERDDESGHSFSPTGPTQGETECPDGTSHPDPLQRKGGTSETSEKSTPPGGSVGSGADAFDDDDDPHWPARQEAP
ncbi:AAA family ATPase [Cyanobium sp. N5-Cardenillas]|uniref:AAA family ATPase n=1 Tax=Cyanobium sp. N5-Cardenillas TaxID=2823720 RepID=UPI0020CC571B|nr:AAA family ATPase [Cyanobium sp. N5-Cardenillas]MCP9786789.1 AAA family ATPase [Cyanobium sp. N5-Cardenillas]